MLVRVLLTAGQGSCGCCSHACRSDCRSDCRSVLCRIPVGLVRGIFWINWSLSGFFRLHAEILWGYYWNCIGWML